MANSITEALVEYEALYRECGEIIKLFVAVGSQPKAASPLQKAVDSEKITEKRLMPRLRTLLRETEGMNAPNGFRFKKQFDSTKDVVVDGINSLIESLTETQGGYKVIK